MSLYISRADAEAQVTGTPNTCTRAGTPLEQLSSGALSLCSNSLRELLVYDPATGSFTWRSGRLAGLEAGGRSQGYLRISIKRVRYMAHRLAWLYMTGEWPIGEVDHINVDSLDNRWANLRDVTRSMNAQNRRRAMPNNKTGLIGARIKRDGRIYSRIVVDGRRIELGSFTTAEQAHEAYVVAKRKFHKGNTL